MIEKIKRPNKPPSSYKKPRVGSLELDAIQQTERGSKGKKPMFILK
jgi:hypothetical protein